MKFIHTGDLHIGKTVNEFSLIEDQRYFLNQMIELVKEKEADALIIAGDIYDRSIPSAEAVLLLDEFLSELVSLKVSVLMISGNHDSPERIGFAGEILKQQGVFIASMPEEGIQCIEITSRNEESDKVNFLLLPFVKPAVVGAKSNQEAVELLLNKAREMYPQLKKKNSKNVLVTHYFVTNGGNAPELSDSETAINVGGLDNVEVSVLKDFTYVALGHIHKPQQIGDGAVYYAGTPIKYSFSEINQEKGVNLVTIEDDTVNSTNAVKVTRLPIKPLHDMRKIAGKLEELIQPGIAALADCNDYIQVTLTNEEELIDPIGTLRSVYPNTMQMILAKNEIEGGTIESSHIQKAKSILELYEEFYEIVREEPLPNNRMEIVVEAIRQIEE